MHPRTLADSIDRLIEKFVHLTHPEVSSHPTSRSWALYSGSAMAFWMPWEIQRKVANPPTDPKDGGQCKGRTRQQVLPAPNS